VFKRYGEDGSVSDQLRLVVAYYRTNNFDRAHELAHQLLNSPDTPPDLKPVISKFLAGNQLKRAEASSQQIQYDLKTVLMIVIGLLVLLFVVGLLFAIFRGRAVDVMDYEEEYEDEDDGL